MRASSTVRFVVGLVLICSLFPAASDACDLHPKDPDKVRFLSTPTDSPDPFDPARQTSGLTVQTAVRRTEGLKADERHPDADDHRTFYVRAVWTISSKGTVVATLEKQVEIRSPYAYVELPAGHGTGKKTFIAVPDIALAWDGRPTTPAGGAALPDGTYDYTIEAEFLRVRETKKGDKAKEIDDTPTLKGTVTLQRGSTPAPTLTLTSPADGAITRESFVTVSGSVAGQAPLSVTVNGQAVVLTNGTFSYQAPVPEGPSTVTVIATDGAGRTAQKTASVARDSVAPQIVVAAPAPGSFIRTATPVLTVSYSDPAPTVGLDLATFQAVLDGQDVSSSFNVQASQATFTPPGPLADGSHSLVVRIRDRATSQAEATSTFTVDTRAPVLAAVFPVDGATITATTPRVDLSFSDPSPGSGLLLTSFHAVLDTQDVSSLFSVTATGASFQVPPSSALGAGSHQIDVEIGDQAGNTASIRVSFTVLVDTVAPTLALSPADGSAVKIANPILRATYSDPAPSSALDLSSFMARLDGVDLSGSFVVGATEATYTPAVSLAAGQHVLTVRIRDRAGNATETASTFDVDTVAPTIVVSPASDALVKLGTPTITVTFTDAAPSGGLALPTFSVTLDGADITTAFAVGQTQATYTPTSALPDGQHTLAVRIADRAGNTTELVSSFRIDTAPPTLTIESPVAGTFLNVKTPAVRLTYSDGGTGIDTGTLKIVVGTTDRTSLFTVTPTEAVLSSGAVLDLADGQTSITAQIGDRSGNTAEASVSFFVDTGNPTLTLSPASGSMLADGKPTITATLSDPDPSSGLDAAALKVTLDGTDVTSAATLFGSSVTYTPATALPDGAHTVVVRTRDRAGNAATASATFTVDGTSPTLTLSPGDGVLLTTGTPALMARYGDAGSGVDVASLVALVDGQDHSTAFSAGTTQAIFQIPDGSPLAEGSHTFQVKIRDRAANQAERSVSFTVDTRPPAIAVETPADGSTVSTTTPAFEASFSDPTPGSGLSAGSFRASLDDADVTALFTATGSGATYQPPPGSALAPGAHRLVVTIADTAGHETTAQASFTIVEPPTGPVGTVVGRVLTGTGCVPDPVAGATVSVVHGAGRAITDTTGRFVLTAPVGTVWLEVDKPGYLFIQRSAQVVRGQDTAMAPMYLAPQDPKVTHVAAAQGGSVTDSTGNASIEIPAGVLPADLAITLTLVADKRACIGPPMANFIPGSSVRITPERVRLNGMARVRVKNAVRTPAQTIYSFDWNPDTQVWERAPSSVLTPDGQFYETHIAHFSGTNSGCGPLNTPSGGGSSGPTPPGGCGPGGNGGGGGGGTSASGATANPGGG